MSADSSGNAEAAPTTAETSGPRRIWLCADDYGISASVNAAIRDLVVRGRINATSVMVTAPTLTRSEAVSLHILNAGERRVALGLHLTLTAPYRPGNAGFKPSRDGAFLPVNETLARTFTRSFHAEQLRQEIERQLSMFEQLFGHVPDFVDGHQHVQLFPQFRDAMLTVVKEKAPTAWVRQCGSVRSRRGLVGDRKRLVLDVLSRSFRRRAQKLGLRTNTAFAGTYDFHDTANFAALFPRFLDNLPDGSLVMCHPGFVDAELKRLDPLTTLREREYAFLASDSFPGILAEHGVALA